jgi:hypothetical protein
VSVLAHHVLGLVYPLGQFPEVFLRSVFFDPPNGGVKRVGRAWIRTNQKTELPKICHSKLDYSFVLVPLSVCRRDAGVQHGLEEVHGHALIRVKSLARRAKCTARQPSSIRQVGVWFQPFTTDVPEDEGIRGDVQVIMRLNPTLIVPRRSRAPLVPLSGRLWGDGSQGLQERGKVCLHLPRVIDASVFVFVGHVSLAGVLNFNLQMDAISDPL